MANQYVDPKKRYEDEHSTGVLFLSMGSLGTLAVVLCFLDILKFPLNNFQLFILLAMFFVFIFVGIWSYKKAAALAKTMDSEEQRLTQMKQWISENKENFCSEPKEELSGTELYFYREQEIRQAISGKYPDTEDALLELLVEETYQSLFEK